MRLLNFVCALGMLTITIMGCKKDEERGKSQLMVRMHDTIGPYAHVWVNVAAAYIHYEDEEENMWHQVEVNEGFYDLLELQGGVDTILVPSNQIDEGHVTQFRLVLEDDNYVILTDSSEHHLTTPSAQQSGIKFEFNHVFEANEAYEVVFDFDVMQSVHLTGSDKYMLKPVIKVESITEIE